MTTNELTAWIPKPTVILPNLVWAVYEEVFKFIDKAKKASETEKQDIDNTIDLKNDQKHSREPPAGVLGEETVYIHCMRGRSRSAAMVIGYLMSRHQLTLQDAYMYVKLRRTFIGPHDWMKKQLCKYELELRAVNKDYLKATRDKETLDIKKFRALEKSHNWEMLAVKNNISSGKGQSQEKHEEDIIKDEQQELNGRAYQEMMLQT
ncbi:dual specificity protein phosphatase, partial [Acrasis kona]